MARTRKTVSMISKADEGQSNNWDFPVYQEQLVTRQGVASGIHAVVRGDTGAVIGQYKGVKLLPNSELVAAVENKLGNLGLTFKRSCLTTNGGSRFFAEFTIDNMNIGGESFARKLEVGNSYDGSMKKEKAMFGERASCLNSMIGFAMLCQQSKKHSLDIDVESWVSDLGEVLENGSVAFANRINQMREIELPGDKARNILSNLVDLSHGQGMSERSALLINHNWANPSADELPLGNTLYRLFNAATRYTRDVAKVGRFELSHKSNVYIGTAFDLALERGQMANLLNTPRNPIDFDAVTVSNN